MSKSMMRESLEMFFKKVFVFILLVLFNVKNIDVSFASDTAISSSHDLNTSQLKAIAEKIINQPNVFDTIKNKLRSFHSPDAKTVWSSYSQTTLPKALDSNYNTHVKIGTLSTLTRKNILQLVGKPTNTFYTATEINTIESEVQTAITNGTIKIDPRDDNTILITHPRTVGELCTKNAEPPLNVQCNPQTTIAIVLVAKAFFDDIQEHGSDSWKSKSLSGLIQNIY
jgi:hypothetical protein